MKKLFTLFISFSSLFSLAQAPTSCSLDPIFVSSNKTGIWPDSATNFINGTVGMPYGQNITVKVPKDTVTGNTTICFNRVELSTPTGFTNFNLPPGLNLLAGPTVTNSSGTYKYPGNASSCSVISGTPTSAGTYTLQFKVQPYLTPAFPSCPNNPNVTGGGALVGPTTLKYYIITITAAAGIKEEINSKSLNLSNVPNPFSGKTTVKFTVKDESAAKISVYNLLGERIFDDKIKTTYGENSYELYGSDWSNGIYLLTIQYKNHTETRRMVINTMR
ncbi:MAG: T9SS type A sorting domain-containing protein [Bacteroidetes bacterium]|nr:T9SS type A sorting domain-containing protein [Bacteroidota bacterium]